MSRDNAQRRLFSCGRGHARTSEHYQTPSFIIHMSSFCSILCAPSSLYYRHLFFLFYSSCTFSCQSFFSYIPSLSFPAHFSLTIPTVSALFPLLLSSLFYAHLVFFFSSFPQPFFLILPSPAAIVLSSSAPPSLFFSLSCNHIPLPFECPGRVVDARGGPEGG